MSLVYPNAGVKTQETCYTWRFVISRVISPLIRL